MKTIVKTALAAAGAAAVGTLSAYVTTKVLVDAALDRNIPQIMYRSGSRVSGSKSSDAYRQARKEAAERLLARESETVELTARDGERLIGHLIGESRAKRLIIAVHGWRSSWTRDFGIISDFWLDDGCAVLFVEQRGQGESGGEHMGFGLLERYDCADWAVWASERFSGEKELPIYLAGVSMGAASVLMASCLELPHCVRGIIADCGFTSPDAIWRHVVKHNLHLSYKLRRAIADSICRRKLGVGASSFTTTEALKRARLPVLFIHGSDDSFVPVEMTFENYKACVSEKRLLIVPGAGHAMSFYVEPESYRRAVRDFWRDFC